LLVVHEHVERHQRTEFFVEIGDLAKCLGLQGNGFLLLLTTLLKTHDRVALPKIAERL
jgi:hypothetical protein